jgi:hypothetical protein
MDTEAFELLEAEATTKDKPMTNNVDKRTQMALDWLEANRNKNDWNNKEDKLKKQLVKEAAHGNFTVDIDDQTEVQVGFFTDTKEEIDPKALFKKDPEAFWLLVSVPKGAVEAQFGEKDAAKMCRTVTKSDFKVKKVKKK